MATEQMTVKPRRVILTESEQRSLHWLLRASDNGALISGSALPDVMRLKGVARRLEMSLGR
jgi:hypothetical protein